ncbi:hypothetical protein B0T09DRAFT_8828 [Sordaria sp. MPI-SDFR-AT-0083]|nr:hypothetical protein B0T09DRAFT_8828 [Sordaria sp. MPI-SDFR-AT-0083]
MRRRTNTHVRDRQSGNFTTKDMEAGDTEWRAKETLSRKAWSHPSSSQPGIIISTLDVLSLDVGRHFRQAQTLSLKTSFDACSWTVGFPLLGINQWLIITPTIFVGPDDPITRVSNNLNMRTEAILFQRTHSSFFFGKLSSLFALDSRHYVTGFWVPESESDIRRPVKVPVCHTSRSSPYRLSHIPVQPPNPHAGRGTGARRRRSFQIVDSSGTSSDSAKPRYAIL